MQGRLWQRGKNADGTVFKDVHTLKKKEFFMDFANLVPVAGTIWSIDRAKDCCSRIVAVRSGRDIVNFVVTPETIMVDNRQLRAGMRIAAFYDSSLPAPLIFPPQYRAALITALGKNEQIMLNYFNKNLTASDNSLRLNIDRRTQIGTINGQDFTCDPANHVLLVYYTETTRSIPPQTTPRRIIVICGNGN